MEAISFHKLAILIIVGLLTEHVHSASNYTRDIVEQISIANSKAYNLQKSASDINGKITQLNESNIQDWTTVKAEYIDNLNFYYNSVQCLLDQVRAFRLAVYATAGGDPRVNIDSAIDTLKQLQSSLSAIKTKLENADSSDKVKDAIIGQVSVYSGMAEAVSNLNSVADEFQSAISELKRTTPTFPTSTVKTPIE